MTKNFSSQAFILSKEVTTSLIGSTISEIKLFYKNNNKISSKWDKSLKFKILVGLYITLYQTFIKIGRIVLLLYIF